MLEIYSSGHRTMKLAKQKRRISEQLAKLSDLEKSVAQKKSQIEKLKSDKAMTTVEIENIESKLESTNALIEEYTVSFGHRVPFSSLFICLKKLNPQYYTSNKL